jgi:pyruvate dehydrogenase complex dehydrogenase (E1) component
MTETHASRAVFGHQGGEKGASENPILRAAFSTAGRMVPEVLKAAQCLADEPGIACEVSSATSYSELARQAR